MIRCTGTSKFLKPGESFCNNCVRTWMAYASNEGARKRTHCCSCTSARRGGVCGYHFVQQGFGGVTKVKGERGERPYDLKRDNGGEKKVLVSFVRTVWSMLASWVGPGLVVKPNDIIKVHTHLSMTTAATNSPRGDRAIKRWPSPHPAQLNLTACSFKKNTKRYRSSFLISCNWTTHCHSSRTSQIMVQCRLTASHRGRGCSMPRSYQSRN